MSDLCYHDEEPHPFEPDERGPDECYTCGAGPEALSIYNSFTGLAWCCTPCREGRGCDCLETA
jgi:hypothetical protein